jgi:Spy/CpxP family protein refolding chaperone
MGMTRMFVLTLLLCAAPLSAQAQTWPGWPGPPPAGYDPHIARAEQHAQAMERLRLQADQRGRGRPHEVSDQSDIAAA